MTAYTDLVDRLIRENRDWDVEWNTWANPAYPFAVTFAGQRHLFNPDGSPDTEPAVSFGDLEGLIADD